MSFDPYWQWLQIPPARQPPDHYTLLGLERMETDEQRIRRAAHERMAHVRRFRLNSRYGDQAQQLLGELALAFDCLTNHGNKQSYDAALGAAVGEMQAPPVTASSADPGGDPPPTALPTASAEVVPTSPFAPGSIPDEAEGADGADDLPEPSPFASRSGGAGRRRSRMSRLLREPLALLMGVVATAALVVVGVLVYHLVSPPQFPLAAEDLSLAIAIEQGNTLELSMNVPRDPQRPRSIKFRLGPDSPAGATIESETGVFHWTPSEETEPRVYPVEVVVAVAGVEGEVRHRFQVRVTAVAAPQESTIAAETTDAPPPAVVVAAIDLDGAPPMMVAPFDKQAAQASQVRWAKFLGRQFNETNSLGMELILVPPGSFSMGSPPGEAERHDDEEQVAVTLSQPFFMGKYEVTQSQWQKIMQTSLREQQALANVFILPPGEGPSHPMYFVSYDNANDFCHRLTQVQRAAGELPTGWEYRLPTEAQWEFACRAGTSTATCHGDSLGSELANFNGEFPYGDTEKGPFKDQIIETGRYLPNQFGLYDMPGNVWEWCRDWYVAKRTAGTDPEMTSPTYSRVIRGGAFDSAGWSCRSASRNLSSPTGGKDAGIGFRVVQIPANPSTAPVSP